MAKLYKAGKGRKTRHIEVTETTLTLYETEDKGKPTTYKLYDGEYKYWQRIAATCPEIYGNRVYVS